MKMMRKSFFLLLFMMVVSSTVANDLLPVKPHRKTPAKKMVEKSVAPDTIQHEILLQTSMGNIRFILYKDTPKHRDNMLKLVRNHELDGMLWHRVIANFMIQTGDPYSKVAKPGEVLGGHQVGGKFIPAEILFPKYYHKRGAIAAARESDDTNPTRQSSGSQFYIVWGKRYTDFQMDAYQKDLDSISNDSLKYTPEIRKAYFEKGGVPYLDGTYTVFGEVVDGLDVVDKIQNVATDQWARPKEDVKIIKATVVR